VTALVGAEVTAALPEWRSGRRSVSPHHRRGDQLSLALAALALLKEARNHGVGMRSQQITRELQSDPIRMLAILEILKDANVVTNNDSGRWILSRDLSSLSLHQLCYILGITLSNREVGRTPKIGTLVERLADQETEMLSLSVDEALDSIEGEPAKPEPKSETPPQTRSEPRLEPKLESRPDPRLESRPEPRLESRPEPRPEPRLEPRLESRPEPKLQSRPEPKLESRPEPKLESRPEPKLETRPEPKPEPRPESRPEPRQQPTLEQLRAAVTKIMDNSQ
jgi:hypothetical protein